MLYALLVAAIVILIAEQGDKTQILALALATKYKAWQVLLGILMVDVVVLFLFKGRSGLLFERQEREDPLPEFSQVAGRLSPVSHA